MKNINEFEKKFPDQNNVPRPPHWSGWRLLPEEIEFWLDGEGRIHERLNYRKNNGKWESNFSILKRSVKTKVVKFCKILLSSVSGKIAKESKKHLQNILLF